MTQHPIRRLLALLLCGLTVSLAGADDSRDRARLAVLNEENWDRLVPRGKEVDAIYGDVVIRNGQLTAVIAQPVATRNANMTVRDVAGALIDLTSREFQSDQLSAFYPGGKSFPYRDWSIILPDGSEQDVQDDSSRGGRTVAVRVEAAGGDRRPAVSVTYRLRAGRPYLEVVTRFTNQTDRSLPVTLSDMIRADGGKEEMVKSPNGVHEIYTIDDRYWQQAYGFTANGMRIESDSSSRESTLKYQDQEGSSRVELSPGETYTLSRRLFAGRTLMHVHAAQKGKTSVPVALTVQDSARVGLRNATLEFLQQGEPFGAARADVRGNLVVPLVAGTYTVTVSQNGHVLDASMPLRIDDETDQRQTLAIGDYQPGTVVARITDERGEGVPCKIELTPQDETPLPDFGPETAEFAVRNLRYAPRGRFRQSLHPGTYDVIVSRGPEYDAIFTEVVVKPGEVTTIAGTLVRSVDTTGWISSDFHSHSSPSGDNTGSQLGRVLNLVCENIEFAPCTEHNRIDTYSPHIERLGIGKFLGTCTGMELTGQPLPLNHQNVFPLHHHPHHQDGGGPVTDTDPEKQIERIALWDNRSEKLIQQNHPDVGWLFYDKDGDGQPDGGYERSLGLIDVMEIHPISTVIRRLPFMEAGGKQYNNRMLNWLQLLNQGRRIPGVVNTDAHYNYHGSGWLRNWFESPTDDPADVKTIDVVHASEHGHLVMSNGPFLEVRAQSSKSDKSFTAGDDMTASDGTVNLHIKVQCPNWHDVNRVFVLVNGRLQPEHDFRRETHSALFHDDTVKFDESISLSLESDAHVIVVAAGEGLELGPVCGPAAGSQEPTAVTNPIYVDVDGGGFRPNHDTLGHPLPVKAN